MGSLITVDKKTARKKGMLAAGVAGASVAVGLLGAPVLCVLGLAGAGYLTYDWFM